VCNLPQVEVPRCPSPERLSFPTLSEETPYDHISKRRAVFVSSNPLHTQREHTPPFFYSSHAGPFSQSDGTGLFRSRLDPIFQCIRLHIHLYPLHVSSLIPSTLPTHSSGFAMTQCYAPPWSVPCLRPSPLIRLRSVSVPIVRVVNPSLLPYFTKFSPFSPFSPDPFGDPFFRRVLGSQTLHAPFSKTTHPSMAVLTLFAPLLPRGGTDLPSLGTDIAPLKICFEDRGNQKRHSFLSLIPPLDKFPPVSSWLYGNPPLDIESTPTSWLFLSL